VKKVESNILSVLRYAIFIIFYFLCIRLLAVYLLNAPKGIIILGSTALVLTVILSIKLHRIVLYLFIAAVPLISGLKIMASDIGSISFLKSVPLLSLGFAVIFLVWLPNRLLVKRKTITPISKIGYLVDIFAGIVLLSMITSLTHYPPGIVWSSLLTIPFLGQSDVFWSLQAGYILLQGLLFFRIMETELFENDDIRKIYYVFAFQIVVIILFSLLQLLSGIPEVESKVLYSPFDDIHSYGSCIVLLFFMLLNFFCIAPKKNKLTILPLGFLFCFVILSASVATLLAMIIMTSFFISYQQKSIIFIIVTVIALSLIFSSQIIPQMLNNSNNIVLSRYSQRLGYENAKNSLRGRFLSADQALGMISENPITGTGVGSYYRTSRYYHFTNHSRSQRIENAHNYFLQLTAELGIVALIFFLWIIALVFRLGIHDVSKRGESQQLVTGFIFGIGAYLITMLTGHPLILSNQQFLFWFAIAIVTATSLKLETKGVFSKFTTTHFFFILGLIFILFTGHVYNMIAKRDKPPGFEYGYHEYENLKGKEIRWTEKNACIQLQPDSNILNIVIYASSQNTTPHGLSVDLYKDKNLLDKVHFDKEGFKFLNYYLPSIKEEVIELKTIVDKTFNPFKLGLLNDLRNSWGHGVAIGPIKFLKIMPADGIGFYDWEMVSDEELETLKLKQKIRYRYTQKQASLPLNFNEYDNQDKLFNHKTNLLLRCSHPDIETFPVIVKLFGDSTFIKKEIFTNHEWKSIFFDHQTTNRFKYLTFKVDRTWNPKQAGISDDNRELGVAISLNTENHS